MVDLGDDNFEPARDIFIQNIVYVFKDGQSIRDTNKAYWPRYTFDLKRKIEKSIQDGFSINGKRYTKKDIESITIVYPE